MKSIILLQGERYITMINYYPNFLNDYSLSHVFFNLRGNNGPSFNV